MQRRRRQHSSNKYVRQHAWRLSYAHRLTRVYEVALRGNDYAGFVAYCPTTREWLAYDSRGNLHPGYGQTREAAARLLK